MPPAQRAATTIGSAWPSRRAGTCPSRRGADPRLPTSRPRGSDERQPRGGSAPGSRGSYDPTVHDRRALIAIGAALVAVVLVATGVWVFARTEPTGPLSAARQMLSAAGPRDALRDANNVAVAATLIERELDGCRRKTPGPRCTALAAALGYAQVTAARMIRCDVDGRVASRRALSSYLDRVARIAPDAPPTMRVDPPPTLAECASG